MTGKPPGKAELEAYKLFDQGYKSSSPEVKALKRVKQVTRDTWQSRWRRLREKHGLSTEMGQTASEVISETEVLSPSAKPQVVVEMPPPNPQSLEPLTETESDESPEEPGGEDVEKPAESEIKTSPDGKKKIPTMVAGQGLTFAITISTKTLMLYQHAASQVEGELTLGDFIDACVEDAYTGRGYDLGLVRIGGNNE